MNSQHAKNWLEVSESVGQGIILARPMGKGVTMSLSLIMGVRNSCIILRSCIITKIEKPCTLLLNSTVKSPTNSPIHKFKSLVPVQ
jgi:hypothetical protein